MHTFARRSSHVHKQCVTTLIAIHYCCKGANKLHWCLACNYNILVTCPLPATESNVTHVTVGSTLDIERKKIYKHWWTGCDCWMTINFVQIFFTYAGFPLDTGENLAQIRKNIHVRTSTKLFIYRTKVGKKKDSSVGYHPLVLIVCDSSETEHAILWQLLFSNFFKPFRAFLLGRGKQHKVSFSQEKGEKLGERLLK